MADLENKKHIYMVEKGYTKPIKTIIASTNLIKDFIRLEAMTFFKIKHDEEKIEYIIGRAGYDIVI